MAGGDRDARHKRHRKSRSSSSAPPLRPRIAEMQRYEGNMRERPDSEGGASRNCHQSPFGFAAAPRSTVWQRLHGQEDKPSPTGGRDDDSSRIDETGDRKRVG